MFSLFQQVNEAQTDQFSSLAEMCSCGQVPVWFGIIPAGCHPPAETRDGQMTASASLFQFGIRQVRLNRLWFKLICFDSLVGTDHWPQLGGSNHQRCLSHLSEGLAFPDPPATAVSEGLGLGFWWCWQAVNEGGNLGSGLG